MLARLFSTVQSSNSDSCYLLLGGCSKRLQRGMLLYKFDFMPRKSAHNETGHSAPPGVRLEGWFRKDCTTAIEDTVCHHAFQITRPQARITRRAIFEPRSRLEVLQRSKW